MKIKTIKIENYRSIKNISIDLMDNLNVFVGINGSGKTTILNAISTSLTWIVNRIQRPNSSGSYILETDIRNGTPFSSIEIKVLDNNNEYVWKIVKTIRGVSISEKSALNEVSDLAKVLQEFLVLNSSLPVIAYYPVNRIIDKTVPELNRNENLSIFDVYDNAIGGKINYQSFFEWFRLQDDIVNEEAMSRSKWILQNQDWIKRRVIKLVELLKDNFYQSEKKFDKEEFDYLIMRFNKDELIFKEPRFLFHELTHLIDLAGMHTRSGFRYEKIFHDLEYMFHKMEKLSYEYRDDLIDEGGLYEDTFIRIIKELKRAFKEKPDNQVVSFIWETFVFANLISLWWMSEKGKRDIERQIRKNKPDITELNEFENKSDKLVVIIKQIIKDEIGQKKNSYKSEGKELKAVTKAIEEFIPGYSALQVKRIPRPHISINKGKENFNLDQLSDGEKNLITLVGDIARKLSIANPNSKEPLKGEGIILIDEIDLHLHPQWQRLMIPQLTNLFPNCQFIVTTHSPQVISHVKHENLFLLKSNNNTLSYSNASESYGMNTDRILEDLLETDARPKEEKLLLHNLFRLIQDGEIEDARRAIEKFEYQDDPELVKARVLIKRKEIIGK